MPSQIERIWKARTRPCPRCHHASEGIRGTDPWNHRAPQPHPAFTMGEAASCSRCVEPGDSGSRSADRSSGNRPAPRANQPRGEQTNLQDHTSRNRRGCDRRTALRVSLVESVAHAERRAASTGPCDSPRKTALPAGQQTCRSPGRSAGSCTFGSADATGSGGRMRPLGGPGRAAPSARPAGRWRSASCVGQPGSKRRGLLPFPMVGLPESAATILVYRKPKFAGLGTVLSSIFAAVKGNGQNGPRPRRATQVEL